MTLSLLAAQISLEKKKCLRTCQESIRTNHNKTDTNYKKITHKENRHVGNISEEFTDKELERDG